MNVMDASLCFRLYDIEIHQGENVVKFRLPLGLLEEITCALFPEHNLDGTSIVVTGMSLKDSND